MNSHKLLVRIKKCTVILDHNLLFSSKVNIPCDSDITVFKLRKKDEIQLKIKNCTQTFVQALFIILKKLKITQCL